MIIIIVINNNNNNNSDCDNDTISIVIALIPLNLLYKSNALRAIMISKTLRKLKKSNEKK